MINRYTPGVVAALSLAGCGAQVAPTGSMPQSLSPTTHGKSWTVPGTKSEDLLYASAGDNVYVFSYPAGKLVGTLKGFHDPQEMCSDKNGSVWIANDLGGSDGAPGQLLKYAHGGTKPILTLSDAASPIDCSVDPTTGNLAVVNVDLQPYDEGLAVYPAAKGKPRYYKIMVGPGSCTYDNRGDVFVTGRVGNYQAGIEWLQKGDTHVEKFPLHPFVYPHYGAQWDGKYLAVANRYLSLYQYALKNKMGEQIRELTLDPGLTNFWIEGSRLVATDVMGSANDIYIYPYPKGGRPAQKIVAPSGVFGVTVSAVE
jgi:streptogramin lyase